MISAIYPASARRPFVGSAPPKAPAFTPPRILMPFARAYDPDPVYGAQYIFPIGIPRRPRSAVWRGLYRIFNAAQYRLYRSTVAPPVEGSTPFATSATLPTTPGSAFANGTWYLSVSYFNGVLDSGFLPIGPNGQTYLTLEIAGGVAVGTRPSPPIGLQLVYLGGGVSQIRALYLRAVDGAFAADQWAVNYTVDGSAPVANAPNVTKTIGLGAVAVLAYTIAAQPNGAQVQAQVQVRRGGTIYSLPLIDPLDLIINTNGPLPPDSLVAWPGAVPE